MTTLTPLLQVFDMIEASRFYRDVLGFEVVATSPAVEVAEGRFSHWMRLRNGGVELMLNTAYDSNERPTSRDLARWSGHRDVGLFIDCPSVEMVDALHAKLVAHGLVLDPPSITRYGMRSFIVHDPDGYELTFQTRLATD